MKDVDLVVLDCDGVLVDSERLTVGVEARVLTELGWPLSPEDVVARWMGRSSAFQLAEVEQRLGRHAMLEYDARTTAEVHRAFAQDLRAVEGVTALLDALDDAGVTTCVASSGTHDRIRLTLGLTGLHERLEGRIYSATEVAHGKPAPDLFLHVAASLDFPAHRCAVVEDSVYGVRAAVAAGMRAFGYAGGLTPPDLLAAEGAVVFDRMADLVALL